MPETDKRAAKRAEGEAEVLAAIAAMAEPDRTISERLHAIIAASAPDLLPRTWYGMPAYTDGDKIVCWFRSRKKFGERYMTIGFNDTAKLDTGNLWPISYALTELSEADEKTFAELIRRAIQ
jgi:hypothetical protein